MTSRTRWRWVASITSAIVLPIIAYSVYLTVSRWPDRWFTSTTDYVALYTALLAGAVCLVMIPARWFLKIGAIAVYAPAMFWFLYLYSFEYVCFAFQDCI